MMGINNRWSNGKKVPALGFVLLVFTAAAPVFYLRSIDEAGSNHILNNVSVFDGPPEHKGDLIGLGMDARDIDPYPFMSLQGHGKDRGVPCCRRRILCYQHKTGSGLLQMTETNAMWSNSLRFSMLCLVLLVSTAAAPASCPRSINEAGSKHVLDNPSVFDGPPEHEADLIGGSGVPTGCGNGKPAIPILYAATKTPPGP